MTQLRATSEDVYLAWQRAYDRRLRARRLRYLLSVCGPLLIGALVWWGR